MLVWSFFFVAYLIMLIHIFGDLFGDKELGGFAKVLWVVALFVFPLLAAQEEYIRGGSRTSTPASPTETLTQAKSLLDNGAISPEEYSAIKARALA